MKTTVSLILIILLVQSLTIAQTLEWVKTMGGSEFDVGEAIAVDDSGYVYTAGFFQGKADFNPNSDTSYLTVARYKDIFLQKLDALGNLCWAKNIGDATFSSRVSIELDKLGYIYILGVGGALYTEIQKLDSKANLVWAKHISYDYNSGSDLAVDNYGNIYVIGSFMGTIDIDPGDKHYWLTSEGRWDTYIQKLDKDGNFLWGKSMGWLESDWGVAVFLDDSANVYSTGSFKGVVDFDPDSGIYTLEAVGSADIYIQKLDKDGNFLWAKNFGGTKGDAVSSIAIDASGAVYTIGSFNGTVDFDPGLGSYYLTATGLNDIFIQKLNTSGKFLWAKVIGGTQNDRGNSIALDPSGNVYITGYLTQPDNPTDTVTFFTHQRNIHIQKRDSRGYLIWKTTLGGHDFDTGASIDVDELGMIYVTGSFRASVDFDPGPDAHIVNTSAKSDIFVLKLTGLSRVGTHNSETTNIHLYPNPNRGIFYIEVPFDVQNILITILDNTGRIVHHTKINGAKNKIDLYHLPNGIYFFYANINTEEQLYGKILLEK